MRTIRGMLLLAAVVAVSMPQLASATDVEAQLQIMQEQILQLQDQLEDSNRRVDRQQDVIQRSELLRERDAASGLSGFLETIEIGGTVAASYNYSFNQPTRAAHPGGNVNIAGHPNVDQFQFDQLVFDISRPTTEESPAGFTLRTMFGAQAAFLGVAPQGGEDNNFWIHEASIDYQCNCDFFGQLDFKLGMFATPIGAESVVASDNWNISQGVLWGAQPVNHTGIIVRGEVGDTGIRWLGGVSNDNYNFSGASADNNRAMSYLWGAGYGGDNWDIDLTFAYGSEIPANETDHGLLIDLLASVQPADNLELWLNFDYGYMTLPAGLGGGEAEGYGLALAQRYQVTERFSISAREEYLYANSKANLALYGAPAISKTISLTVTGEYKLTDHLSLRAELRHDNVEQQHTKDIVFFDKNDDPLAVPGGTGPSRRNQTVALVQAVLAF